MRTISLADAELLKAYANIRYPVVPYTWETAPAAAGNTGLIVPITNVSSSGYDLFVSDGTRLRAVSGSVEIAVWVTRVVVNTASSNEASGTTSSVLKIAIPTSATNGSLFGDGDIIRLELDHSRSSGGTGSTFRTLYLGTHPTNPLSNTLINRNTNGSTTNLYVTEEPSFVRVNSTTIQPIGRRSLDQRSAPSATGIYNSVDDRVTGISSIDAATMYLDVTMGHVSNVAETVQLEYARVVLYTCGPVTG